MAAAYQASIALSQRDASGRWIPPELATMLDFVNLPTGDSLAYGRALAKRWNGNEDLCVVEQDIVPGRFTLADFAICPEGYCAASYEWLTDVGPALGCTRFRAEFMARYPDVMDEVVKRRVPWNQVDVVLQRHILVRRFGEQPHVHEQVTHLNESKRLLPDANPEPLQALPAW